MSSGDISFGGPKIKVSKTFGDTSLRHLRGTSARHFFNVVEIFFSKRVYSQPGCLDLSMYILLMHKNTIILIHTMYIYYIATIFSIYDASMISAIQ